MAQATQSRRVEIDNFKDAHLHGIPHNVNKKDKQKMTSEFQFTCQAVCYEGT